MKEIINFSPETKLGLRKLTGDIKTTYHWAKRKKKGESFKKGYLTLTIPIKERGMNSKESILKIEREVYSKGVRFDVGQNMSSSLEQYREWHLDWSLSGAKPEHVMNFLKRKKIKFMKKITSD